MSPYLTGIDASIYTFKHTLKIAEVIGAIVVLNDADGVLGHRAEGLQEKNDRFYEILHALESHRGPTILTTNQLNSMDPKVLSRCI